MRCGGKSRISLFLFSVLLLLFSQPCLADEVMYSISETELATLEATLTKQKTELKRLGTDLQTAETQLGEAEIATNNLSLLHARLATSLKRSEREVRLWRTGTTIAGSAAVIGWLMFFFFR